MVNIRKFLIGLGLIPNPAGHTADTKGEFEVITADSRPFYHDGVSAQPLLTDTNTATVTNKTISGSSNTLTNLPTSALSGSISLTTQVSGVLPIANGGTNTTTSTGTGSLVLSNSPTLVTPALGTPSALVLTNATALPGAQVVGNIAGNAANVTGVVAVANGGTGDSSLTVGGILIGNGTSPVTVTSAGTTGQVLTSNGTGLAPTYQAAGTTSPLTTKGDVYGYSTTNARIPVGTDGQILTADSTQALGVKWGAAGSTSPLTTKGDLYTYSTTNARLAVGTDGQYLVVDSTQTDGIKWQNSYRTLNPQSGTTYTFALTDGSGVDGNPLVEASNSAAQTYTIPPNSSVAFPVGTQIDIVQNGAGLVTLAAGAGVTLNSRSGGLTMLGQYSAATLIKTATDSWDVIGTGVNSINLAISDWVQYIPTFTGFGTVTTSNIQYRRVGDSVEILGKFTPGTTTAVEARISLPNSIISDAAKISSITKVGDFTRQTAVSAGNGGQWEVYVESGVSYLTMGLFNPNFNGLTKQNASSLINIGEVISFHASLPISGWTSTLQGALTAPRSNVFVDGGNGFGSTNPKIRRFTTQEASVGADIAYADSATLGASFTINTTGVYSVTYGDFLSGSNTQVGISVNASSLVTNIGSLTYAQGFRGYTVAVGNTGSYTASINLNAGDIVRAHGDGGAGGTTANTVFCSITKVSN